MKPITLGDKTYDVHVLFTEEQIKKRVGELAQKINQDYGEKDTVVILLVLHGALLFAADLVRGLAMPTEIESVRLRSYHGTESTGKIELIGSLPKDFSGQHVLIVEDIVDSGRSIDFLLKQLKPLNAKTIKTACLLDKPDAHLFQVAPEYVGYSIGRNFVIGYGLDLDGKYRNLPYVAELVSQGK